VGNRGEKERERERDLETVQQFGDEGCSSPLKTFSRVSAPNVRNEKGIEEAER
jgi:hypothetical protein